MALNTPSVLPPLTPSVPATWQRAVVWAVATVVALPFVWPWQRPPLAQFESQWLATTGWSLLVLLLVGSACVGRPARRMRIDAIVLFGVLFLALPTSALLHALPSTVWLLASGVLLVATLSTVALTLVPEEIAAAAAAGLFRGLLVAALINAGVTLVDVAVPGLAGAVWAVVDGRAVGMLGQPNHLALLTLWGMIAAFGVNLYRPLRLLAWLALAALLVTTGSRAAWLATYVLAVLAVAWRLPGPQQRRLMLLTALLPPALFAVMMLAGLITPPVSWLQRWQLWQNAVQLIAAAPITGYGFGQFNHAWTLTPLDPRAADVFDHPHNFPLAWAVDFGLPAALGLLGLLLWTLVRARAALATSTGPILAGIGIVVIIHSLVEYPLWFAHFLLPLAAALALAVRLGASSAARPAPSCTDASAPLHRAMGLRTMLALAACLACAASVAALIAYGEVASLNAQAAAEPPPDRRALVDQARRLRQDPIFGHLGDYAWVMLAGDQAELTDFDRPLRHVIDERLLVAYALALQAAGDTDGARRIGERAREFPLHPLWQRLPAASTPRR